MMLLLTRFLFLGLGVCRVLLLAYAFLSWIPAWYDSSFGKGLRFLVEPLLKPFRRLPLQFGGLDFTVVAALLALQILGEVFVGLLWRL